MGFTTCIWPPVHHSVRSKSFPMVYDMPICSQGYHGQLGLFMSVLSVIFAAVRDAGNFTLINRCAKFWRENELREMCDRRKEKCHDNRMMGCISRISVFCLCLWMGLHGFRCYADTFPPKFHAHFTHLLPLAQDRPASEADTFPHPRENTYSEILSGKLMRESQIKPTEAWDSPSVQHHYLGNP